MDLGEDNCDADSLESMLYRQCRLCISRNEKMVSIFSEEGKGLDLAYKINKLLPTMVTQVDGLPQEVCCKCINQLNTAFQFVKKCMLSQTRLRKMLKIHFKDYNVPAKVIQDYSTHWSVDASIENIMISRNRQMNKSKRCYIETKEWSIGETERNVPVKKMKLIQDDKHQGKTLHLENRVKCDVEPKAISHSIETLNNDDVVDNNLSSGKNSTENNELNVNACVNGMDKVKTSNENVIVADFKHICKYCGNGFPWKADLFDHQTSVHSDVVFRCRFCLKVFYERDACDSHEIAHTKLFPPGYKLKKPLQIRAQKKKQEEKLIVTSSDGGNEWQAAVDSDKNNDRKEHNKLCSYCNITFKSVRMFRKHMRSEHQFRLPCRFCPTTCCSLHELNKHEAAHHKKTIKYMLCKNCERKFESVDELREHELIHMHKDGLKCEICGEAFTYEVSLEEHIKIHGGEGSYLCESCGQNFVSFFIFRVHKLTHIYPDLQRCELCNSCFHDMSGLESHLEIIHKKKKYRCKLCVKSFTSGELLKEHKAEHHKMEYKCELCKKTFDTAKKLRNHSQIHSSERNYLCEKCGKDFKLNSSLHKHRYLCQAAVTCSLCKRKFDCTSRLKVHMRMHTGEKPHVCQVCNKGFHATWALNQHMLTHNTVKVPCPICGILFNRRSNMLTHMMRHQATCDTCGQVFANTPLLLAHQKIHVENGERVADSITSKSYKCDDCGKLFVTSLDLKAHIPSHSEECPHKCDVCDKSFRRMKALKKHMLSHSDRKPYQCRFCTCTFVVHQRLLKHENGHTAGKPYACELCGQGFWSPLNLEKHALKHSAGSSTGQNYNCDYCEKSFLQKSSLIIHKRTHAAQLTYSCSFCPRKFSQLRFMQRHKCALNPNPESGDSSIQKGLLTSLPTLTEEPSGGGDNIFPVSVLNEEIVYDMDSSASYAEIIVISQNIDEFITDKTVT
ncbi:zinc finger protein 271-like isoform X2 [Hetaerina americana]|uniref:zinc finger protein 271-like isoform X2 n=1 Tax=Hetaerina americana TaxID=62018 RepID=UPI003A7F54F3